MTIRAAKIEDVPQVLPMVEKLARLHEAWDAARFDYKADVAGMYRGWLGRRAQDPASVFLVADREHLMADVPFLIGFVVGTVEESIPIYRRARFGFIHDLYVEEDYRNEGIGRQLAVRAVERFKEIGVTQVRLETAAANEPARKLFEGTGFRTSSIEMLAEA